MILAKASQIPEIDLFAERKLKIPVSVLMGRSGEAIADAVAELTPKGGRVIILVGCGNNGGDGYAAGYYLSEGFSVTVYNVFSKMPKSSASQEWKERCGERSVEILNGTPSAEELRSADTLVDAIFGTGFSGEYPEELTALSVLINSIDMLKVVAVDLPLGVNADDGRVCDGALKCDVTVSLSVPKVGLFSYPAKDFVGRIAYADLGISSDLLCKSFVFKNRLSDRELIKGIFPNRESNTNKSSFGRVGIIAGSEKYPGAAALSVEAALRGGVGYVYYFGEEKLVESLLQRFPEVIYNKVELLSDRRRTVKLCSSLDSVLIGPGIEPSEALLDVILALLSIKGLRLVIDAGALNTIAQFSDISILKDHRADVVITPHPLELARLTHSSVDEVQADRYSMAKRLAEACGITVVLKGAATVITNGDEAFINSSGSSALAKAGSGDVLAGFLASMAAYTDTLLNAAILSVYFHGLAGDRLSESLSHFGVTPSDLPKAIAGLLCEFENKI